MKLSVSFFSKTISLGGESTIKNTKTTDIVRDLLELVPNFRHFFLIFSIIKYCFFEIGLGNIVSREKLLQF